MVDKIGYRTWDVGGPLKRKLGKSWLMENRWILNGMAIPSRVEKPILTWKSYFEGEKQFLNGLSISKWDFLFRPD